MTNKTILLISSDPSDQQFAHHAAIAAEATLLTCKTAREGAQMIADEKPGIVLADVSSAEAYAAFENAIQETIGIFSDQVNSNHIHFLTTQPLEKVDYLIKSPLFGNLIQKNYGSVEAAGTHYGRLLRSTLEDRAFGLSRLLKPGTKIQVVKLTKAKQKQDAVEAVKSYLMAAKYQARVASLISNAVDELLMNAIFDAPVDELGKPLLSSTQRTADLHLDGKSAVELHLGYDGTYVAFSAIDHYGSIDRNKLLNHISKIYTEEEYKVRQNVAGAGIGLATVYRSGGSFFFVSEARERTEVTVFFRKTENYREFKEQFRFIAMQFYF